MPEQFLSGFHVKTRLLTRLARIAWYFVIVMTLAPRLSGQTTNTPASMRDVVIVEIEKKVEVLRAGAQTWDLATTNQVLYVGDRVRVPLRGRVALILSDQSVSRFGDLSDFMIEAPVAAGKHSGFSIARGLLYFFHRGRPADIQIRTRTATAAIRGTEFNLEAEESGRTVLAMLDGEVEFSSQQEVLRLQTGDQGIAEPGKPPTKTPVLNAVNVIQWALYYPGVLDLDELSLTAEETQLLERSLTAYRSGDLLQALASYPAERTPVSPAEKIYLGALLLAVGQVAETEKLFESLPKGGGAGAANDRNLALAGAVRQIVAAVKLQPWQRTRVPELATEWLAESYYQQSKTNLSSALSAARKAIDKSPNFAFGVTRVAELEFSFGRTAEALAALERSLALAPRNAEALALKGFLLAAQNKISEATASFDQAIAIDGALGNAWLGRGLCRIRRGSIDAGRKDLLVAAALEPQRALLRSYLGKAYGDMGDTERATKELALAKKLDANDPTAWLYSALLLQQNNRINEAIRDLEKSQELNENRSVYRSQLLLDQDRAVRSANLAHIYRDAGMVDVSVREAARAVSTDYANYSAHLFLANSYDQLRDPKQINLRFETATFREYFLANLLAPVGAGTLSPIISQQEYSKLFERDRFGVYSSTEYLSRGAWVQNGAQFGNFGNFSYSLESIYYSDHGERPNNDLEQRQLSLQLKQQITPHDTVHLQVLQYEAEGGDLFQRYDPRDASLGLRTKEKQEPLLMGGYHHEWAPGVHTLFLAGRLDDTFSVMDPRQYTLITFKTEGQLTAARPISIIENDQIRQEIYAAEAQQIWEQPSHTTIAGARLQYGHFDTKNLQTHPSDLAGVFPDPPDPAASQDIASLFKRLSFYGYHQWRVMDPLLLIGGVSYDQISFPENFRIAPLSDRQESVARVLPKAGLIWTPKSGTTVRAAYTRSLAGASLDQSFQLEPAQVAGFNQAFRSLIPESISGSSAGARFETYGLSLEQTFRTGTYLGLGGELLNSKVRRTFGTFDLDIDVSDFAFPAGLREQLDFRERSLVFTVDQLLGREWALGMRYRLVNAKLIDDFVDVPSSALIHPGFAPRQENEATLHQLELHSIFNHPSGFFAEVQALWNLQANDGYTPARTEDDFWHLNAFAGYRLRGRKAQLMLGVLNITDQDYRLNPLTLYDELPHSRTLTVRFQFSF